MSGNPNKKIKLDFQDKKDGSIGNDDLWGQDDLTAEEFDMLEVQATQSCNQNCSYVNSAPQTSRSSSKQDISLKVHDLKQLQYELEGRVKLLTHSLDKSNKELNQERLNREQLINERMKQFYEREANLKKEVEKMQSILEFKEQEMKSTCSKFQMIKSQLRDRKSVGANMAMSTGFDDFLKRSRYDEESVKCTKIDSKKYHRKYKLLIDMSKGEMKGTEILSSILSTRLSIPPFINFESTINNAGSAESLFNIGCTPVSVLHLRNEQKCDELLDYYSCFLQNHVILLKTLSSKNNAGSSNKNSLISMKWKEAYYSQTVLSYLSDIAYIYSSPSFKISCQKNINYEKFSKCEQIETNEKQSSTSEHSEENIVASANTLSIVQSLSSLLNPKTYPNGYSKNEEMEFSLSALLAVCLSCPENISALIDELPSYFLSNPHQSVSGLCATLKLVMSLYSNKSFNSYLIHRNSNCIFCLIATLLLTTVPQDPEKFAISQILIEKFLSVVFPIYNFKQSELEAYDCISKVVQGLIKSLWIYFQVRTKINLSIEILKKGFHLLHFMACCIPNFKEKRNQVENEYISLISGILAVSKENSELKEFYELIHSLWDFQSDISEFDVEELAEETQVCTNEIDVE